MHILGAWHLEQPDWSGRILLPIGVAKLEFFGPIPEVGSHLLVRGHNEEESARQARHGVELFAPDGRLWFRMTGAAYWRFYLPFGDVNFFGPKDQYFLSHRCLGGEPSPDSRCYSLEPPLDLLQPVLRASGVRVTMTPREIAAYTALTGTDAEQSDWFFSRLLAKDAVRSLISSRAGFGIFPADMESDIAEDGTCICRPRDPNTTETYPSVAVAVAGGMVAAIAADSKELGIAIVPLPKNGNSKDESAARTDASRQAAAKALRLPMDSCEVNTVDVKIGSGIVTANGRRVKVQTVREKNAIIATTLGEAP
jgi:hypothetical protein